MARGGSFLIGSYVADGRQLSPEIFDRIGKIDIGLQLSRSFSFLDLNKGTTFACFHSDGTVPDLMKRFNKCVTQSAITTALSFKSRAGRPSGPLAFLSFGHLSCLSTNGLPIAVSPKCFFVKQLLSCRFKNWSCIPA